MTTNLLRDTIYKQATAADITEDQVPVIAARPGHESDSTSDSDNELISVVSAFFLFISLRYHL